MIQTITTTSQENGQVVKSSYQVDDPTVDALFEVVELIHQYRVAHEVGTDAHDSLYDLEDMVNDMAFDHADRARRV